MKKFLTTKKSKIVASILLAVFVLSAGAGIFAWSKTRLPIGMKFDKVGASSVKGHLEDVQFVPLSSLMGSLENPSTESPAEESANINFSQSDYDKIIEDINCVHGTPLSESSDYSALKKEAVEVVDLSPIFDKWFRFAEKQKDEAKNFSGRWYFISYDKSSGKFSFSRLAYVDRANIYSKTQEKFLPNVASQYQLVKMDFAFASKKLETITCQVVDYLEFGGEVYPIQFQYIKTIENSQTTKVSSVLRSYVNAGQVGGYDLETTFESGIEKQVIQVVYSDPYNVQLLKYEQKAGYDFCPNIKTSNLVFYLKQSRTALYFSDGWDYYDEDTSLDNFDLVSAFKPADFALTSITNAISGSGYCKEMGGKACSSCENLEASDKPIKCDHNRNSNAVTRHLTQIITSSSDYRKQSTIIVPFYISKRMLDFSAGLGLSTPEINDAMANTCASFESDTKFDFETNMDYAVDYLLSKFIPNYSLLASIKEAVAEAMSAKELKPLQLNKKEVAVDMEIKDLTATAVIQKSIIKVNASATLKKNKSLDRGGQYSLSLVLFSPYSNATYILISNYQTYDGGALELTTLGQFNLKSLKLDARDANLDNLLNFTAYYAVTKRMEYGDEVCSKLYTATVNDTYISSIEAESCGFTCTFIPVVENNNLKIVVNFVDSQDANIYIDGMSSINRIEMKVGSTLADLLKKVTISDNDVIKSMTLTFASSSYLKLSDVLSHAPTTITVVDRTGNETKTTVDVDWKYS